MSGKDFITFLERIGFPNADELDPDSLDWMFNLNGTKDFMQWLCYDITSENVITPDEITRFEKLQDSGGVILDNDKLEETLFNEASTKNMFINDALYAENPAKRIEILKKQIEETELKIKSVRNRKNLLTKQKNVLESQKSSISKKLPKMEKISRVVSSESRTETLNVKTNDEMYADTVASILPALDDLSIYYDQFCHGDKNDALIPVNLFLSQEPFDRFFRLEAEFTKELQNFACKLFSSNRTTSSKEDFVNSLIGNIFENDRFRSVDTTEMLGDSNSFKDEAFEKLRLMQASISSLEIKSVKAAAKLAASRATREFIDAVMSDLKKDASDIFPSDPSVARELQLKLEEESALMTNGIHELFDKHISKQVDKSANLEISGILLKNYESECVWRRELLANQKQIINKLISQKSRVEFLSLALKMELREHENLDLVLSTMFHRINNNSLQSAARINLLGEMLNKKMAQSPSMPILSYKERFLHNLNTILTSPSPSSPVYGDISTRKLHLTMDDLKEMSTALYKKITNRKSNDSLTRIMTQENAHSLSKQLKEIINAFPPPALKPPLNDETRFTQMLLPACITQPVQQLEEIFKRLDKTVGDVLEDVKKKKSTIAKDKLLARERLLFVQFFTNPEMFLSEIKHIKAEASKIRK